MPEYSQKRTSHEFRYERSKLKSRLFPIAIAVANASLKIPYRSKALKRQASGQPSRYGVQAVGSQELTLAQSATYVLRASNAAGVAEWELPVRVELPTSPPTITKFVATPSSVAPGQSTWLWMNVDGAEQLSIDQGVGSFPGSTQWVWVTPPGEVASVTYTLTAANSAGSATRTFTVTMLPPDGLSVGVTPPFVSLSAGGTQAFTAEVQGATTPGVVWSCSGGSITEAGVYTAPVTEGAYTVTATTVQVPSASATATVTVRALPVIVSFTATPSRVSSGASSTLRWSVSNADEVKLDGIGIQTGTSYTTPGLAQTTTYTLIVRQGDVFMHQSVTVQVAGFVWVKDIVYLGSKEVAEVDKDGLHVTLTDHLGSPRYELNAAGQLETEQKYMPFGESLTNPATMKQFAKGFTNHEQTDPSGLIYMQARFYAPIYGRFLSPDPARDQHFEQTQSWNIYSYVQNNPISFADPTGMMTRAEEAMLRETGSYKDENGNVHFSGAQTELKSSESSYIQPPGTAASFMPIYGSAKQASSDFDHGKYVMGTLRAYP